MAVFVSAVPSHFRYRIVYSTPPVAGRRSRTCSNMTLMEPGKTSVAAVKKPTLTPKSIIHQKFGSKAVYTIEEVQEAAQNGCPGLTIPQKGPNPYRCILQLPEISVVSELFRKKKDAEQSAAQIALEKLGIHPSTDTPTVKDAWVEFVARVKYIFTGEFLSVVHPLSGHLRATLLRCGELHGSVPASVIAACDGKIGSLCKLIEPESESNPLLIIPHVMQAAASLSELVVSFDGQFSLKRKSPHTPEVIESLNTQNSGFSENILLECVYIPCILEQTVEPMTLNMSATEYYLDVIARKLGLLNANKILVSRTVGKANSESRLYFAASEGCFVDISSSDNLNLKKIYRCEGSLNVRASYLCGQDVCGDAVLATVGYTRKSMDLFYEDFTLQAYYRMLISKLPGGIYKLSREATLAANLPLTFTTRANWKGSLPREILCAFCRQHRLSEPVFNTSSSALEPSSEVSISNKKLKVSKSSEEIVEIDYGHGYDSDEVKLMATGSTFTCEVQIYSKTRDILLEYSTEVTYKKQNDSIQNASLRILLFLGVYFDDLRLPLDKLTHAANNFGIILHPHNFLKEFIFFQSIHGVHSCQDPVCSLPDDISSVTISGPDSGACPSAGSLISIIYSVCLLGESEPSKELLESHEDFEFEMGNGAVFPHLGATVAQMSVGQSACYITNLPPKELVLAAAKDSEKACLMLSSSACFLEYTIVLLQVTEPPEDRMEQALFSPPLSKQRVEYALQLIKESRATTLVDFGCGSGSLLDSLLDCPTTLQTVAGVDISQKGLARASKTLHSKLSINSSLKSAVLYDGSITVFDSRLCGFDIATCLEVIEHMEEEQACLFGDVVLSSFRPRTLIVSTPNYEYNVILQKSSIPGEDDDQEEKSLSQSCKFRNHDHKFEWTREQFNHWASELAARHSYRVEFSGVGGAADREPGFASQIAVFRREEGDVGIGEEDRDAGQEEHYRVIWEWNRSANLEESNFMVQQ